MPCIWNDDRYLVVGLVSIKPILTGNAIGKVLIKLPDMPDIPVNDKDDVQMIMEYAIRNSVSGTNGRQQSNGNGTKPKREFRPESIQKMVQARKLYWEDPERGGKRRKKEPVAQ